MNDNIKILARLLTEGHITAKEFKDLYQGLNKSTPINIPYDPIKPFGPLPSIPVPYIPNQPFYTTSSSASKSLESLRTVVNNFLKEDEPNS